VDSPPQVDRRGAGVMVFLPPDADALGVLSYHGADILGDPPEAIMAPVNYYDLQSALRQCPHDFTVVPIERGFSLDGVPVYMARLARRGEPG
jgi:hypothetical protein